jgi:transposase InsO family protein
MPLPPLDSSVPPAPVTTEIENNFLAQCIGLAKCARHIAPSFNESDLPASSRPISRRHCGRLSLSPRKKPRHSKSVVGWVPSRQECLNTHWFMTLSEAKEMIEAWRREYNESRPHRALGERTPNEFACQVAASRDLTGPKGAENSP